MLEIAIGVLLAWAAIDTATMEAAIGWPKWLLVPALVAYAFGFLVAGQRSSREAPAARPQARETSPKRPASRSRRSRRARSA